MRFPLVCLARSFKQLGTPAICTRLSKVSEDQALDTVIPACPHKSSQAIDQEITLVVSTSSIKQLDTPVVCAGHLDSVGGTSTGHSRLFNNIQGTNTEQLGYPHKSSQATGRMFSATKPSSYPQFGSSTSNLKYMRNRTMICWRKLESKSAPPAGSKALPTSKDMGIHPKSEARVSPQDTLAIFTQCTGSLSSWTLRLSAPSLPKASVS